MYHEYKYFRLSDQGQGKDNNIDAVNKEIEEGGWEPIREVVTRPEKDSGEMSLMLPFRITYVLLKRIKKIDPTKIETNG